MPLINELPLLAARFKELDEVLSHNRELFNIHEGDLRTYVLKALEEQLSPNAYKVAKHRVAPINVLKRMVDKLSKIYVKPPTRQFEGGSDGDQKLLDYYDTEMRFNVVFALANKFFNLFKNTALEPYLDRNQKPRARTIPSDRFFVYSNDPIDPLRVTHFVKIMGEATIGEVKMQVLYAYTDTEFMIFNEKGNAIPELMATLTGDAAMGINPVGRIPFTYISRSRHELVPTMDTDTLQMTKLIPVMLTDVNYAIMFQAFSILYGIDLDDQDLVFAPSKFLKFKTDPAAAAGSKPELGMLKPEMDSDKVLDLIMAQLSFWLQSKNIKPGAMGKLGVDNVASGVAKAIDEMDTSEDRQEQVEFFREAEADFFDLLAKMNAMWIREQKFEQRTVFSVSAKVKTQFAEQRAIVDSSVAIDDQIKKMGAGLESKRGALMALNPDWTEKQVDDKLAEIAAEGGMDAEEEAGQEGPQAEDPAAANEEQDEEPSGQPEADEEIVREAQAT